MRRIPQPAVRRRHRRPPPDAARATASHPSLKFSLPNRFSNFLHDRVAPCKRTLLSWQSARHLRGGVPQAWIPLRPRPSTAANSPSVMVLRKRGGTLRDIAGDLGWLQSRSGFSTGWRRCGVFVDLLSRPQVPDGDWAADLGDAVTEDGPVLGFCSNRAASLLVPDRGFYASRGYARARRQAAAAPTFADRDDLVVWRGRATGHGVVANATMAATDTDLLQRVRMCLLLGGETGRALGVDARIVAGRHQAEDATEACRRAGIIRDPLPEASWTGRRFAIDIDGYSNAFSNLFIRLLYGCCVIKIASPSGFRQWYYDRLEPWRHYLPVAADMSDLVERIDWCRRHPEACRDIAAAGQAFATSLTPEQEYRRTAEMIGRSEARHSTEG